VVELEVLKQVLLGVLIEMFSYFLIKSIEKKKASRKGRPKHMREV